MKQFNIASFCALAIIVCNSQALAQDNYSAPTIQTYNTSSTSSQSGLRRRPVNSNYTPPPAAVAKASTYVSPQHIMQKTPVRKQIIAAHTVPAKAAPLHSSSQDKIVSDTSVSQTPEAQKRNWEEYKPLHLRDSANRPMLRGNITAGYRVDNLDWNIAGNIAGENPNILSELTWDKLQMYEVAAQGEYTHRYGMLSGIHADFNMAYAEIFSGDNQDSDYLEDNRNAEFSRSNNSGDDGDALTFKAALGYEIGIDGTNNSSQYSWITPLVGYSYNEVNLSIKNGFQTLPEEATGPFPGLDSAYDATWDGPFLGVKGGTSYGVHRFGLRGEYHIASYEGVAQWNLRREFAQPVSFLHTGDATGFALKADYSYALWNNLGLYASAAYQSWQVEDGNDTTIFTDGVALATRLNEVNWDSQSYNVGLAYSF